MKHYRVTGIMKFISLTMKIEGKVFQELKQPFSCSVVLIGNNQSLRFLIYTVGVIMALSSLSFCEDLTRSYRKAFCAISGMP